MKVFVTSALSQIYQLASQDSVFGLAFSPDQCCFYDVRGYYANVWEPNALIKFAEQVGKDADTESETGSLTHSSTVSVSSAHRIDSIPVLAASPTGQFYCCGTELGTVRLYDVRRGRLADLYTSRSFFSIEKICWSDDGCYVCFCDLSKRVVIVSITSATQGSEAIVKTVAEVSMHISRNAPILQLLFDPKSQLVLLHSSSKLYNISLATASVIKTADLPAPELKCIAHPNDPSLIIGFDSHAVHLLGWDLTEHGTYMFHIPDHPDSDVSTAEKRAVERVVVSRDKKHILVQMCISGQGAHRNAILYFDTSSFASRLYGPDDREHSGAGTTEHETLNLTPYILPQSLSSHVNIALSFLSDNRLVFLSKTASLCTLKISTGSGPGTTLPPPQQLPFRPQTAATTPMTTSASTRPHQSPIKEIFPLPGDWIGRDSLALSAIWGAERSLLVPRNGEVAVVRCAALV